MSRPILALLLLLAAFPAAAAPIALSSNDRLLILAPHPDDEVLAAGGLIQAAVEARAAVRVVFLTSGDREAGPPPSGLEKFFGRVGARFGVETRGANPGRHKGRRRMSEAREAARRLGLGTEHVSFLGYPDSLTFDMLLAGWDGGPPLKSKYTGADAVPYVDAYRRGAPYKPAEVIADLVSVLSDFQPSLVVLPHAADHNPDHRSLAVSFQLALWTWAPARTPALLPFLIHYPGWPKPGAAAEWPTPLVRAAGPAQPLSPRQVAVKKEALDAHVSQGGAADPFLSLFIDGTESFGRVEPLRLSGGAVRVDESVDGPAHASQWTGEDRTAFLPLTWTELEREREKIQLSFDGPERWPEGAGLTIALMGDRPGTPPVEMPKVVVTCDESGCAAADRGRAIAVESVWSGKKRRVTVPLDALGRPARAVLAVQTVRKGRLAAAFSLRSIELGLPR